MVQSTIRIEGVAKVNNYLNKKERRILFNLDKGIQDAGKEMQTEIKDSIRGIKAEPRSVDTGEFRDSVQEGRTGKFENTTSTDVKQAKYMEYGTSRIPARRHFRNSVARLKNKIISQIKNTLM